MENIKPVGIKSAIVVLLILFTSADAFSQLQETFEPRYSETLKGSFTVIANNTVSRTRTGNYNGTEDNQSFDNNVFVDIDNDPSTFQSSNAVFANPKINATCLVLDKVMLYWAAADKDDNGQDNVPNWNYFDVKLRLPGQANYANIRANEVIFRGRDSDFSNEPYICYRDITAEVSGLANPYGTYQVANVESKIGSLSDGGNIGTSGGWQIVFVYKSPDLTLRNVTIFDGYAHVTADRNNYDIRFDGFQTVPNGTVSSDILIGALEGDRSLSGDALKIRNVNNVFENISVDRSRDANNFFNSRITIDQPGDDNFLNRTPASTNTLGFDSALFKLINRNNDIIGNNQTSATIRLASNQETYGLYLVGLSIEVFEPDLGPISHTATPSPITPSDDPDANVITYNTELSNNGNDNALDVKFETTLPAGTVLVEPVNLPNGISYTYNAATNELVFNAVDGSLDKGETISFDYQVRIKTRCEFLADGCSTTLESQMVATYKGEINGTTQTTDSSGDIDDCGVGDDDTTKVEVNEPAPPVWDTAPGGLNDTFECSDLDGIEAAQALNPSLDCDNLTPIKTAGVFVPDATTCAANGTYTNTWTFEDACGNTVANFVQVITIQDTTPPDLTLCEEVKDETLECNGTDNETIANQWNQKNLDSLKNCGTDDCGVDSTFIVASDYDYGNLDTTGACGIGGKLTVKYTVSDECGNAAEITAILTLEDSTGPDLSSCTVTDKSIECSGTDNETIANQWNADNIDALKNCASDECNDANVFVVTSDYDFSKLDTTGTCGIGGKLTVTYTVADDCNNGTTLVAVLTLEDTTPPDLSPCDDVKDESIECTGTNNETIANQWNTDNIEALKSCVIDECNDAQEYVITSNYDYGNLDTTGACGIGGKLEVIYTVADDCGNAATKTVTLTLEDTTPPDLSTCDEVKDESIECTGTDNETVANQWNADNIEALRSCSSDQCNDAQEYVVTSNYDYGNLDTTGACGIGGTLEVTYTVADDCGNEATKTATLTLEDTTPPDLSNCEVKNEEAECGTPAENEIFADQWNAANIAALEGCAGDACNNTPKVTVTSDYDFDLLNTSCGPCGTLTVNYSVADDCGNATTLIAVLTFGDATPPDTTNCNVKDETIECGGELNETIADEWNQKNLDELGRCINDANVTITSNYEFTNIVTTCGAGGTIAVTYIVTDECGNPGLINATLTLEDSTGPDLSNCTVTDKSIECSGTDNETIANQWNADNIAALKDCPSDSCDIDSTFVVTSDYDFSKLDTTGACGIGGTLTVIYKIADDCDNETTLTAVLTLEDSTGPDLSSCTVTDKSIECSGTDNETIANQWNTDNIEALKNCATDECNNASVFVVTSDYDFSKLDTTGTCGIGGTLTVTYTVSDDCDNGTTLVAVLTLEDTTPPVLSTCDEVKDESIECTGTDNETVANQWNADNIEALKSCVTDECNDAQEYVITSNYDYGNLDTTGACGIGGTLEVIYTVADDCGNEATKTVTLTLEDTTPPDLSNCEVKNEEAECGTPAENETFADQWNAANIAALEGCAGDACNNTPKVTVTSDYDFDLLNTSCGPCGTLTVNYSVADDCGNATTLIAVLTFGDATPPDTTNCNVKDETIECGGELNETIADEWNQKNLDELGRCINDANVTVTSNYEFTNIVTTCGAGGTIAVTYTATDECGNPGLINATLTLEDSTPPTFEACDGVTDQTIECSGTDNETIANQWNTDNIAALQNCATDDCDVDANFVVTSDYDFSKLDKTGACGIGGTLTVTYTVTDDCGIEGTKTAILTLEDSTAPDISTCDQVTDKSIECSGSDNETIANQWNADNIEALKSCASDECNDAQEYVITSDYDFSKLNTTGACGSGGTLEVTYNVADDCGNAATRIVTLTLEDSTGPDVSICGDVLNETIECGGTDNNEAIANQWNQKNLNDLLVCATDECNADAQFTVSSNYDYGNLDTTGVCGQGGRLTVEYTVADDCNNASTVTAVLFLEDTTGPQLNTTIQANITVVCSEVPDVPELEFVDGCTDEEIKIEFEETNGDTGNGEDYEVIRTWTVTDICDNTETYIQTISVTSDILANNIDANACYDDGPVDLFEYLPTDTDTSGEWVIVSTVSDIELDNGIFDPSDLDDEADLGDYIFSYTTTKGYCLEKTEVTIALDDECVVLACGEDDFSISKALTPNGDQYNQSFEVKSIKDCGFAINLKVFNRYGAIVYENKDYQNDWSAAAHSSSIGGANQLPNGTYYYLIILEDSGIKPISGPFFIGTK